MILFHSFNNAVREDLTDTSWTNKVEPQKDGAKTLLVNVKPGCERGSQISAMWSQHPCYLTLGCMDSHRGDCILHGYKWLKVRQGNYQEFRELWVLVIPNPTELVFSAPLCPLSCSDSLIPSICSELTQTLWLAKLQQSFTQLPVSPFKSKKHQFAWPCSPFHILPQVLGCTLNETG